MGKVLAFARKEFLEVLPPTLFFLVVFHIVVWVRSVIGAGDASGVTMATSAAATVGALVVGKAILVADALPVFRWLHDRILVFDVVWRLFLYMSIVFVFQVLEELLPLIAKHGALGPAVRSFSTEVHAPTFWATHAVLAVFLAFYCVVTALIAALGADRFWQAFFGWERSRAGQGGGGA